MFDASASLESGFTFGHNLWLGNSEVCHGVAKPVTLQTSPHLIHHMKAELLTSVAPFPVDFRVIYLRHNSSWQVDPMMMTFGKMLHVGLCLPSSCTEHEIRGLVETYLSNDLFASNKLYDMNLQYDYAKDLKLKTDVFRKTSFYLCCLFTATTIGLTIAAGILRNTANVEDINVTKSAIKAQKASETAAPSNSSPENLQLVNQPVVASSFIACYDIQANWQHIFKPAKASHTFAALNGLRFGSAVCVTVYHYMVFLFNGTRNKLTLFNYQVHLGNLDVFVDIFFTIRCIYESKYFHIKILILFNIILQRIPTGLQPLSKCQNVGGHTKK